MSFTDIHYEVRGSAAIITLNRPETLNALTYHTLREIRTAVDQSVNNPDIVGIVFTGSGRGFCSGLDAQVLANVTSGGETASSSARREDDLPGLFFLFARGTQARDYRLEWYCGGWWSDPRADE